jgi:serine O-acetyltransferase
MDIKQLIYLIKTDFSCYLNTNRSIKNILGELILNASLQIVIIYRISHFCHIKNYSKVAALLQWFQIIFFSCYINRTAKIGERFKIAHPIGIVIGADVTIGSDVVVWQNVTIGAKGSNDCDKQYPVIGNNVRIFAGAVIVGGIKIGDNAIIGALSFINQNIPENCIGLTKCIIQ